MIFRFVSNLLQFLIFIMLLGRIPEGRQSFLAESDSSTLLFVHIGSLLEVSHVHLKFHDGVEAYFVKISCQSCFL